MSLQTRITSAFARVALEINNIRSEYFRRDGSVAMTGDINADGNDIDGVHDVNADGRVEFGELQGTGTSSRIKAATVLPGGYVESTPLNFRFDESVTAFAGEWATVTGTNIAQATVDRLFTFTSSYTNLYTASNSGANDVVIEISGIDITNSANRDWSPYVLMHGGNTVGDLKIELKNGNDVWETVYDGPGVPFYIPASHHVLAVGRLKGAKWTWSNLSANHYLRMVGVIGKTVPPYQWSLLRTGGDMYGGIGMNGRDIDMGGGDIDCVGGNLERFTELAANGGTLRLASNFGLDMGSARAIRFSSTTGHSGAKDCGFQRDAAGVVRATDGSSGYGDIAVEDEVFGSAWDGSQEVPTKNAVYDAVTTTDAKTPVAAGSVNANGSTNSGFGCSVSKTATGTYAVTFDTDQGTSAYIVVATILDDGGRTDKLYYKDKTNTSFNILTAQDDNSATADVLTDHGFDFVVFNFTSI